MSQDMAGNLEKFACLGRKIIGAGLNYKSLAAVQKVPLPKTPIIFTKPPSAYITEGQKIWIPKGYAVNEEVELGVIIGKKGKMICEKDAMDYVGGYCVALDMTATSYLAEARSKGKPWDLGKGYDTACPVSTFIPKCAIKDAANVELWCDVNGKERQRGNTNDLIFSIPSLISFISQYMTLEPNDLILTGSAPGMGPVLPGDVVEGGIKDIVKFRFEVTDQL